MFGSIKNKMNTYQENKRLEQEKIWEKERERNARIKLKEEQVIKSMEEEIDKFFNTILPTFFLLEYSRDNLLSLIYARTCGSIYNISGNQDYLDLFNAFYTEYLNTFIKLLEKKDITLKGREIVFVDTFISKIRNKNYNLCLNEFGTHFKEGLTFEEIIIKYIDVLNWNTGEIRDVGKLCFLSEFVFNKRITSKKFTVLELDELINEFYEIYKLENRIKNSNSNLEKNTRITIENIDLMNGQEFESFLADLFINLGYKVETTKTTGDQGVDLMLYKSNQTIAVQAKCYSNTVGNSAIQQVVGGQKFYSSDKTMVVTNNYFTNSAKELANANSVLLWDRDKLIEMMNLIY